jgi:hypothetical protein
MCEGPLSYYSFQIKAQNLYLEYFLLGHLAFLNDLWFGMASRKDSQTHVLKQDWTACSKYGNHSRPNNRHTWRNLHDYFIRVRNFTLIVNKIFI